VRRHLEHVLGWLAGLLLLAMMAVTVVDVVGRYFLNSPLPGAFELTELGLVLLIFAGLPLVSARDGHVNVPLLVERLGPRARAVQRGLVRLLGAALLALVAWRLWVRAGQLLDYGDRSVFLGIPLAPVAYCAALGCGLSAILTLLARRPHG